MIKKYGAKVRKRRKGVKGVKEEEGNRKKNIVPSKKLRMLPDRELNPGLPRDRRKY